MQLSRAHWSLNLFKFNYMTLSRLDEHCKAINALWDKNNTVSKRPGGGAAGGRVSIIKTNVELRVFSWEHFGV